MKVFCYKRKLPEEANQSMAWKFTTNKRNQGKRRRVIAQTFYSLILFSILHVPIAIFFLELNPAYVSSFFSMQYILPEEDLYISLEKMLLIIMREKLQRKEYRSLKLYYFAFRSGNAFCLPYSHYTKNSFLHIIVSVQWVLVPL